MQSSRRFTKVISCKCNFYKNCLLFKWYSFDCLYMQKGVLNPNLEAQYSLFLHRYKLVVTLACS